MEERTRLRKPVVGIRRNRQQAAMYRKKTHQQDQHETVMQALSVLNLRRSSEPLLVRFFATVLVMIPTNLRMV